MSASPEALAETYISALHAGDTETLRSLFIEQSSLYGLVDGDLAVWPREVWLEKVAGRHKAVGYRASSQVLGFFECHQRWRRVESRQQMLPYGGLDGSRVWIRSDRQCPSMI